MMLLGNYPHFSGSALPQIIIPPPLLFRGSGVVARVPSSKVIYCRHLHRRLGESVISTLRVAELLLRNVFPDLGNMTDDEIMNVLHVTFL
jgi:hypothetical protein